MIAALPPRTSSRVRVRPDSESRFDELSESICERGPQGLRGASSTRHPTSGATNIGHTGELSKQAVSNSLVKLEEMRTVKRLGKCTTKLRDFVLRDDSNGISDLHACAGVALLPFNHGLDSVTIGRVIVTLRAILSSSERRVSRSAGSTRAARVAPPSGGLVAM
jgi:hypothetical protein